MVVSNICAHLFLSDYRYKRELVQPKQPTDLRAPEEQELEKLW